MKFSSFILCCICFSALFKSSTSILMINLTNTFDVTVDFSISNPLSVWNETVVVGDSNGGLVYVFYRNATSWIQQEILNGSYNFGFSVSIYENHILIGAPNSKIGGNTQQGAAYIFYFNGTAWIQQQELISSDGASGDLFGYSVSIYGNYSIIGAPNSNSLLGSAYIFYFNGSSWIQQQKLFSNEDTEFNFGGTVLIAQTYAFINSQTCGSVNQSCVYVFHFDGVTWNETQILIPISGPILSFGSSLSIDQNILVVGYPHCNSTFKLQGCIYIFNFNGSSWLLQQQLFAPSNISQRSQYFGYSVSISNQIISTVFFPNFALFGMVFAKDQTTGSWITALIAETKISSVHVGAIFASSDIVILEGSTQVYYSFVNINTQVNNNVTTGSESNSTTNSFSTNSLSTSGLSTSSLTTTENLIELTAHISIPLTYSKHPSSTTNIIIIASVIGSVTLVALVLLFIFFYHRFRRKPKSDLDSNDKTSSLPMETKENKPQLIVTPINPSVVNTVNDLTQLTDIQIQTLLGSGSFGEVFKGQWDETPIALKKLKNGELIQDFEREAIRLNKLNHPNIVRFYGIYKEKAEDKEILYIVTEFVELGCLSSIVGSLEPKQKLQGIIQVSTGLHYLQSNDIIHRDLALRNLLVKKENGEYFIKISDLGMSTTTKYYSRDAEMIPIRWCSPEVLKKRKFSFASDIWAFGITIWEIYSNGVRPYVGLENQLVIEVVLSGVRLNRPDFCPPIVFLLVREMWQEDPAARPSIKDIGIRLQDIQKELYNEMKKSENNISIAENY